MPQPPRKWKYWPDWDGWHISNGDTNFIVDQISANGMSGLVAALNFCEGLTLDQLENAPDTATNLFKDSYKLLDNYAEDLFFEVNERATDADSWAVWQTESEQVEAHLQKLEIFVHKNEEKDAG